MCVYFRHYCFSLAAVSSESGICVSLLVVRTFVFLFACIIYLMWSCGLCGMLEFGEFKILVSYENSG